MKTIRRLTALACMMLLVLPAALAQQAFTIDPDHRMQGMGRTWRQGYTPLVKGDTMTLHLPLRSDAAKGQVTARFLVDSEAGSPFVEGEVTARTTAQQGVYALRFTLPLHPDRQVGVYGCRVEVTGKNAEGQEITEVFPLSITVPGGAPALPGAPVSAHTPLRITQVQAEGLKPGGTGNLNVTVDNTTATQRVTGLRITMADASGDIVPSGADTLYREQLEPGDTWQAQLPLTVLASAAAKPHPLTLTLRYTDMSGALQEAAERHTVLVQHAIALKAGMPTFPQRVVQQSVNDYAVALMNMGDGTLRHVLLTFEVPGFAQGQSVLVGEIPRDESRTAKAALTASAEVLGEQSGTVRVDYEDEYGTAGSFTIPFSATVDKKPPPPVSPEAVDKEAQPPFPWLAWGTAGLLLVVLLVYVVVSSRKIRRLEEEGL